MSLMESRHIWLGVGGAARQLFTTGCTSVYEDGLFKQPMILFACFNLSICLLDVVLNLGRTFV